MRHLTIECYYYNGKDIKQTEQPAYISNERLYIGEKRIEYDLSDINYEIRDINGISTLVLINPLFRKIALNDFANYLFEKTELYKQLQELKKIASK